MRLSIIIPYFNTEIYTDELLAQLEKQGNKDTEIILVDDGSDTPYEPYQNFVKVFRQTNKGVSAARNLGLKKAKGDYIVFIDSDDLVTDDYIAQIFHAIESNPDTVYISWRSIDRKLGKIISSSQDEFNPYNRCVWNRVFSREYIKGLSFPEGVQIGEDDAFLNSLPEPKSKTYIEKQIYLYRSGRQGSLIWRYHHGEIPEIKTQVVMYCANCQPIGGIETFMYQFVKEMYKYYDILVLYDGTLDARQMIRLAQYVRVAKNEKKLIECDTFINIRLTDEIPSNVKYKKLVQMSHTCQLAPQGKWHWEIKKNYDELIFVSQAAADSFADQHHTYKVISNLTDRTEPKKTLLLVSACRLTWEKGEERMYKLAEMFRNADVPFVWLVFSGQSLKNPIPNVVRLSPTLDVRDYFRKADYVVQLSDIESFCYTLVEALELGIPVLTTPLSVLPEIGFENEKNGYLLPFDMKDVDVRKFYENIPNFEPRACKNDEIVKQWRSVLGNTKPKGDYLPDLDFLDVVIVEEYNDLELGRALRVGERVRMRKERAIMLINRGLVAKV